ncbi:unnamed protein product [Amoebophrya sp. A120]|nr:unnamed protein product [Amoebophrya sp. A120]|eukprot:GSA120T00001080001.1
MRSCSSRSLCLAVFVTQVVIDEAKHLRNSKKVKDDDDWRSEKAAFEEDMAKASGENLKSSEDNKWFSYDAAPEHTDSRNGFQKAMANQFGAGISCGACDPHSFEVPEETTNSTVTTTTTTADADEDATITTTTTPASTEVKTDGETETKAEEKTGEERNGRVRPEGSA